MPTAGPTKRFSLIQQLEEIDRELQKRAEVYPRLVRSGSMRQSVADYHVARLRAVRASLQWLADNETDVRAYVAAKRAKATEAA